MCGAHVRKVDEMAIKYRIGANLRFNDTGTPMKAQHVRWALGLRNEEMPRQGIAPRVLGNVLVWIDPKIEGDNKQKQRLMCMCPVCCDVQYMSRFHAHLKTHE